MPRGGCSIGGFNVGLGTPLNPTVPLGFCFPFRASHVDDKLIGQNDHVASFVARKIRYRFPNWGLNLDTANPRTIDSSGKYMQSRRVCHHRSESIVQSASVGFQMSKHRNACGCIKGKGVEQDRRRSSHRHVLDGVLWIERYAGPTQLTSEDPDRWACTHLDRRLDHQSSQARLSNSLGPEIEPRLTQWGIG